MYIKEILWIIAWPAMITLSYYLSVWFLKKFDTQIKKDPLGEDLNP
jgi:hypothetical protein